ncbi:glycoside hydrolase family 3 N-terminal domain-containing protein [Marinoscillum sp.]|uniref:glycoside hydrolase family 3 N-terminal domain-containing protein n=1 Tax=Marinoscillum sp. TaxID=2024838 RepID=UPI003BAA7995
MRIFLWIFLAGIAGSSCNTQPQQRSSGPYDQQIDSILQKMTLYEKVGQMYQCLGRGHARVGDSEKARDLIELVKAGGVGSILVPGDVHDVEEMQRFAVEESRLGIPLFFNYDVIHGFKTIFPMPLALSCSWDTAMVRRAHQIAALEAASAGISYNHGPMADVSRDPRWGRVMEGNGEDPFLSSLMTQAAIRGFQGNSGLDDPQTIMACVKHFIGYGAVEGGRDYNTADFGEETLRNIHLPPFQAAIDEGVASVMTSFNVVESVPTVAHEPLLRAVLRKELGFEGIVISDFGSVGELIKHGYATNASEATNQALTGTVDIEMQSRNYHENIQQLIDAGELDERIIDEAVGRILQKKFELGLFENPYRFATAEQIDSLTLSEAHRKMARESAERSMVLLKNNGVLPMGNSVKNIAIIGPFADSKDILGRWSAKGDTSDAISLYTGMKNQFPEAHITKLNVGDFWKDSPLKEAEIIRVAKNADLVLLALGEPKEMSAEAASRATLDIPGNQNRIAELVKSTGKPSVLVLFNGRPLTISWYQENVDAILDVWFPGTEGGNAIASVLAGEYNPSGKLTMTFPRHVGQVPLYYNHYGTGRPAASSQYSSKYIDIPNGPLYPFGFGLSYTTFSYSNLKLNRENLTLGDRIEVSVTVTNIGNVAGEEIVQLYIRDHVGEIVRPVKELKGFRKILLKPGEDLQLSFAIDAKMLQYWSSVSDDYIAECGTFSVMVGPNSAEVLSQTFELIHE